MKKHLKSTYTFFLFFLTGVFGFAQQILSPACGTITSTANGPLNTNQTAPNAVGRYAYIYPSHHFGHMKSADIEAIFLNKSFNSALSGDPNLKIYLSETTMSIWPTGSLDWASTVASTVLVYDGNPTSYISTGTGYKRIPLQTTFNYTGQNLIILFEYSNPTALSSVLQWRFKSSGCAVSGSGKYSANTTGVLPSTLSSTLSWHPDIGFDVIRGACSGTPIQESAFCSPDFLCTAAGRALIYTENFSTGSGMTYQWESSTDLLNWTNVPSGNVPVLHQTYSNVLGKFYRRKTTCTTGGTMTSNYNNVPTPATYYNQGYPKVWNFESTWLSNCETEALPDGNWNQTEYTSLNSWRQDNRGSTANWASPSVGSYSPSGANGTSRSARLHISRMSTTFNLYSLDVYFNASSLPTAELNFWHINPRTPNTINDGDPLFVYLSTDGGISFGQPLLQIDSTTSTWIPVTLNLNTINSSRCVLRFSVLSASSGTDVGIDEITIGPPSNCTVPNNFSATLACPNNIQLSWSDLLNSSWEIHVPTNYTVFPSASANVSYTSNSSSFSVPNQTAGWHYFYVRSSCGTSNKSPWVGPIVIYVPLTITMPYLEPFNNYPYPIGWPRGPLGQHWNLSPTSELMYTNSSFIYDDPTYLITPIIPVVNGTLAKIDLTVSTSLPLNGLPLSVDNTKITVRISTNCNISSTVLTDFTMLGNGVWNTKVIDLSAYAGQFVQLTYFNDYSFQGGATHYIMADNFIVENMILPVELLSFKASLKDKQTQLTWATASETNNDRFEVEHSTDGRTFRKIGTVQGAGNSTEEVQYAFVHDNPTIGVNYYRLQQIDFDGTFEYSDVISLVVEDGKKHIFLVPNPAQDFVSITCTNDAPMEYTITNASGQLVKKGIVSCSEKIDILHLPKGMYQVSFASEMGLETQRFVKSE